jgi:autotransporter translocation and assembly factor TamB
MTGRRALRWVLVGAAALILLVTGVFFWATTTQSASRRVVAWALGKSAAGIEIDEVRGPLRGPLVFLGVTYRSGGITAKVDSVYLEWRLRSLFRREVHIGRLHVTGFRVTIPDSAPPDTAGTARARREKPSTPMPVTLGEVQVRDFEMDAPGGVMLRQGWMDLDGRLDDYRFLIRGIAIVPSVDTTTVELRGRGNLEAVQLGPESRARALAGSLRTAGEVRWYPGIAWELAIAADSLQPSRMMDDPRTLPGWVAMRGTTSGVIDSMGPAGRLDVDSLGGVLRGQPVSGRVEARFWRNVVDHLALDVNWGGARVLAKGAVHDTVSLEYSVHVQDFRRFDPAAGGLVTVQGEATGPRLTPRIRARIEGARWQYGQAQLARLSGTADVDLARGGRTVLDLTGDSARVGQAALDRMLLTLDGTQGRHTLRVDGVSPTDTVRVALAGGLDNQIWSGRINEIAVHTVYSDWNLEQPARASFSATSARLDSVCVVGDSAAGQICATGGWRTPDRLDVVAFVEGLDLNRLPLPGVRGPLPGRLDARLEARQSNGLNATLTAQLADSAGKEAVTLEGRATLPGYRLGRPLGSQSMEVTLTGNAADLTPFEPLFPRLDSLRGAVDMELTLTGAVRAPSVDGVIRARNLAAGLPGRRTARGSFELVADVEVGRDRSLAGELRLTQNGVAMEYRRGRELGRLSVDSGIVVLTGGPQGLRSTFGFAFRSEADSAGAIAGELSLPEYRRMGTPLATQPVTLRLDVGLDLAAFQPLAPTLDSLAGSVEANLTVSGMVGMPEIAGKLRVLRGNAVLAFGTRVQGNLLGDLNVTVRRDSTIAGTLRVVPDSVRFHSIGGQPGWVQLRESALDVRAGPEGVSGTLNAQLVSADGEVLGRLEGRGGLPGYTRIGRPINRVPVEGRVEGRVDDLGFLPSFTALVDSAAGRMTLDAELQGTLANANFVGRMEVRDAALRLPTLGVLYEDIAFTANGSREGQIAVDGRVRSGEGQITLEGVTPVLPTNERPGRILIRGSDFLVANNTEVRAIFSPAFDVTLAGDSLTVRGSVDIPVARIHLSEIPVVAIAPSDDIILTDPGARGRRERPVVASVRIVLGDSVTFRGFNFDAKLGGAVLVSTAPDQLTRASGQIVIIEGQYKAYGQDLAVENGVIRFAGGPVDNPTLSIRAIRYATDSTIAGIAMAGSLKAPQVTLFSTPPMSQSQVMSYLITGHPVGQGGGSSGNFLNKALGALGLQGGNVLTGALGKEVGLSEATIETEGDLAEASLKIGRYLSPNLYVSYGIGLFDPVSTLRLRYILSRRWTLQAETGEETGADVLLKVQRRR